MSLTNFFLNDQILSESIAACGNDGFVLNLSDEDIHHAKVLRLKPGEKIGVIDADKNFYVCEVLEIGDNLIVKNSQKQAAKKTSTQKIWLCQGISKANKFDDIIRACTEIGVSGFIPVAFDRSVAKIDAKKEDSKQERWKKIAKSAAMQSGAFAIPEIKNSVNVNGLCGVLESFDHVFICWEETDDTEKIYEVCNDIKIANKVCKTAIIIGPEGGITPEEVARIKTCNNNTYTVSLGSSILRTETAGVVASAIINFLTSC